MGWDRQSVIERAAVSAATAWGFYLMARFVNHRCAATHQGPRCPLRGVRRRAYSPRWDTAT